MITKNSQQLKEEKAVLVGIISQHQTETQVAEYLDELAFLSHTAGAIPLKQFTQKIFRPDPSTYIGKGKLEEIRQYIIRNNATIAIFDDELSGAQINNIEKILEVKTIDRSDLILDIFARRAKTAQAKTQVELAQYQYILPRLRGLWTHLERLGGGIGTRGPGETEIETDRRIVRNKISLLKEKLKTIDRQNATQRKNRGEYIRVALVGYTNVGKSTIMNLLSKRNVFAENKLFATLDTVTSKIVFEQTPFLLSDTVGFIRKLPHHLIESFKSTLDEVIEADLLLHVVDLSHTSYEDQMKVVNQTLLDLKAEDKPVLTIFNKIDAYETKTFDQWLDNSTKEMLWSELKNKWNNLTNGNAIFISALENKNINVLRNTILEKLKVLYQIRYPYKTSFF